MPTLIVTRLGRAAHGLLRQGEVHSVFQKAVNLMEGGTLITLMSADAHEYALTVPELPRWAGDFQAGQKYQRAGNFLAFPGADIDLDFSAAELWRQPAFTWGTDSETLRNRIGIIRQVLANYNSGDTSGVMARLFALADSWPGDHRDCLSRLKPLLGLGPGLTPLGDDFISGYLAASFYFRPEPGSEELLAAAGDLAKGNTTVFSQRQILLAGQGLCLGSIAAAMQSLAGPDFDVSTVAPVLEIGATSGCGWMLGILCACQGQPLQAHKRYSL